MTLCCMSNKASATTTGWVHISWHCAVCRTKPVLQHQALHTSHGTVLYVEHSKCYNTRLCTYLTTLCCMSNTASSTATPGCAHISRHCAVCRTQPVLQQHQAVHISHDTVLYVEHSQCYSNTRLYTHLTTLCWNPNTQFQPHYEHNVFSCSHIHTWPQLLISLLM